MIWEKGVVCEPSAIFFIAILEWPVLYFVLFLSDTCAKMLCNFQKGSCYNLYPKDNLIVVKFLFTFRQVAKWIHVGSLQ